MQKDPKTIGSQRSDLNFDQAENLARFAADDFKLYIDFHIVSFSLNWLIRSNHFIKLAQFCLLYAMIFIDN